MKVDRLLSSLRKVKQTGQGEWVACCSAHDDRSPSLSIKETSDGMVLIHCFAGCSPLEVLNAVGMTFEDVMPERVGDPIKGFKKLPWNPRTILDAMTSNAQLAASLTAKSAFEELSLKEKDKLAEIAEEMREASWLCQR